MPNKPKTPARTYRFDLAFLKLMDDLGERLGGIDRTAVIKVAVRRLADAELGPDPARKNSRKKQ
jgi:hypothetical protein